MDRKRSWRRPANETQTTYYNNDHQKVQHFSLPFCNRVVMIVAVNLKMSFADSSEVCVRLSRRLQHGYYGVREDKKIERERITERKDLLGSLSPWCLASKLR